MRSGVGNWANAVMSVGATRPMMNGALNVGLVPNPTSSHVVASHIFPSFPFHSFLEIFPSFFFFLFLLLSNVSNCELFPGVCNCDWLMIMDVKLNKCRGLFIYFDAWVGINLALSISDKCYMRRSEFTDTHTLRSLWFWLIHSSKEFFRGLMIHLDW